MKPKVSIVINNYNYARFLGDAIDSALGQTYAHVEVVVVDDGSTDASREVIRDYGDRVVTVLKENGGQGSAFNEGFAAASGDWILYLDADDTLDAAACATLMEKLSEEVEPKDWVQYKLRYVNEKGDCPNNQKTNPARLDQEPLTTKLLRKGSCWFAPTSGMMFSRALLEKILLVPESEFRICADMYLQVGAAFLGKCLVLDQLTLGSYRIHGANNFHQQEIPAEMLEEHWASDLQKELQKQKLIRAFAAKTEYAVPKHFVEAPAGLQFRKLFLRRSGPSYSELVPESEGALFLLQLRSILRPQSPAALRNRFKVFGLSLKLLRIPPDELSAWVHRQGLAG